MSSAIERLIVLSLIATVTLLIGISVELQSERESDSDSNSNSNSNSNSEACFMSRVQGVWPWAPAASRSLKSASRS